MLYYSINIKVDIMIRTYKYRLKPNKTQEQALVNTLNKCCSLYNKCLEDRKLLWETQKESLSCFSQIKKISTYNLDLSNVYSQVLQNVVARVDNAYKGFFRRLKAGDKPGYPRFKSHNRYDSFCYPQTGFKLIDNKLKLSKIGVIPVRLHRNIPKDAVIKTCTIKRDIMNRWFVSFSLELPDVKFTCNNGKAIGIDVGCKSFVTFSNGSKIQHPHYYKQSLDKLSKLQSRVDNLKNKKSKRYRKVKHTLNKLQLKIANQRNNFQHQLSKQIVDTYSTIFVEDLNIKGMTENNYRNLNKSIMDSGWGYFLDMLSYKAEEAGKRVVKVNPAYTSQICSNCGTMVKKELSVRLHSCPTCKIELDRDVNAAINILSFGTKLLNL